jgi:hypothetical protein
VGKWTGAGRIFVLLNRLSEGESICQTKREEEVVTSLAMLCFH